MKRFSLRTLLIAFIVVATALFAIKEHRRLNTASQHYERTYQAWDSLRVSADQVITASEALLNAEAGAFWISREAAIKRHIARMYQLLERAKRRMRISHLPPSAREAYCDQIRAAIEKASTNEAPNAT